MNPLLIASLIGAAGGALGGAKKARQTGSSPFGSMLSGALMGGASGAMSQATGGFNPFSMFKPQGPAFSPPTSFSPLMDDNPIHLASANSPFNFF